MKEIWRIHPELINYEISDLGRVKRISGGHGAVIGRILKSHPNVRNGYYSVQLGRGIRRKIHSLVLEAFISIRPKGKCARHLDSDKSNNKLSNLAWGTYSENYLDRIAIDGGNRGSLHGMSKLTEEQVREIRSLYIPRIVTQRVLAEKFGVSRECIKLITLGQRWQTLH